MHWKKCYSTEHLDASDLDGKEVTIEIISAAPTKVKGEGGEESKILIRFKGKRKQTWIVPITVAKCLGKMFGDDMDGWAGKRVTIRSEQVEAFGEVVDAIRPIGSPDISAPISFKVRQGFRNIPTTMRPTGQRRANGTGQQRAPYSCDGQHAEPACSDPGCYLSMPPVEDRP